MKLSARDAAAYLAKPPPGRPGTLLYGSDAMRVSLKRQSLAKALVGPQGDEEMRLTRLPAGELRRDKAALSDEMKASGFFPGPRAVLLEDAGNQHAPAILGALADWSEGDAHLLVTAGALKAASALRKGFEQHRTAVAIGIYDDPPGRAEIEAILKEAGLAAEGAAMGDLNALAQVLDPGDFRQTVEKLALYKLNDSAPLGPDDIAACAPVSHDAGLDDMLAVIAGGRTAEVGPLLRRLQAQGVQPVGLCIGAMRHFRTLHVVASDSGGPGSGIGKLRPPVYGPRRDAVLRQAQDWGRPRLEQALRLLTETDLALRSSARAPQMALMERVLIRLSMMGRR
ncbi:DNA polymerase III subunit delta [Profundibacterium mesophilum]|uniref:DNA-directed DNA polymerase n=1 Tax=Profundibacterium mesophilum KAUST100406-0324 TaxID=1037889 RepID=A0A921NZQ8_9RHOB|nr:DNA polymerase III subunit delta [Profundibacterium mesophilum]KAF0676523.1 DNA polymerase III subunit delta [Profundibacterium mesophilum KAUST100406-0324]